MGKLVMAIGGAMTLYAVRAPYRTTDPAAPAVSYPIERPSTRGSGSLPQMAAFSGPAGEVTR